MPIAMDDLLFPGFLDDPEIYLAAVDAWREVTDRVLTASGATGWDFRGAYRHADGTLAQDGNPMFELWHEPMAKVVRLIQFEANPGEPLPFSASMDKPLWDDSGRELVICCVLTRRAIEAASALIARWIEPKTTADEMRARIAPDST